jgi:peptidoglycan/xylan/chitin deacetylase (PgdA/CDA1 family)
VENSSFPPTILASRLERNKSRLAEFAEFWKIPYTTRMNPEQSSVIFSSGRIDQWKTINPIIISPMGAEDFGRIASDYRLGLNTSETLLEVPVNKDCKASIRAAVNEFVGPQLQTILGFNDKRILSRVEGTKIHLLSLDLVGEYDRLIYGGLEDTPSSRFRLVSKFPLAYSIVPSSVRNWSLRRSLNSANDQDERRGPVECLRAIFLASIAAVSEKPIPRIAFWKPDKSFSMAITHDVETRNGLEIGAPQLLRVEKDLSVRSTWNIPSDRYPLSKQAVKTIADNGDIGAHDTAHDGRLILLPLAEKIHRADRAREKLERLSETKVRGFRAPLLQHSAELLIAVGKAGYEFDSSVPSWEALSPTSLKPHGVGTVFPLQLDGTWEIPVSLPQDHQLIRIQGLSTEEAIEQTSHIANWIRGLHGSCVLLIHPDYDYAFQKNEKDYRHLIDLFQNDSSCDIMTMKELLDWWTRRSHAEIRTIDGDLRIVSQELTKTTEEVLEGPGLELVTGYDDEGFRVEAWQ